MLRALTLLGAAAAVASAGPVEFGMAELQQAIAERGLPARRFVFKMEVAGDPPESYRITSGLIAGGDLRGVMYGLLDAAEQVRTTGRVKKSQGAPALSIRGVRLALNDAGADWFHSREDWPAVFRMLARNRFNRFNLALDDLGALTGAPERNLETLRFVSRTAADYGIDFALTVSMPGSVDGVSIRAGLSKILSVCPGVRSVQLRMEQAAAIEALHAVQEAGRRLLLEAVPEARELTGAAAAAGVPVRLAAPYPGEIPFARRGQFLFELAPLSQSDPASLAALATKLSNTGAGGFDLDITAEQWAAAAAGKPGAFSRLGRLAYDPNAE